MKYQLRGSTVDAVTIPAGVPWILLPFPRENEKITNFIRIRAVFMRYSREHRAKVSRVTL